MDNKVYIAVKNYGQVRDNIIGIFTTEEEACKAAEFDNRFKDKISSTMGSLVYTGEVNEKYDPSNIYDKCEFCVRMPFMFDKDLSLIETQTWSIRPIIEFDRFNRWNTNEVYFDLYTYDEKHIILNGICKLQFNILKRDEEIIKEAKSFILKEYNSKFSHLNEMIDCISIKIDPEYDFIYKKNYIYNIKIDNKIYDYPKEAVDLVSELLKVYLKTFEQYFYKHIEGYKELKELPGVSTNKTKIRKKIMECLSSLSWYKDETSLNKRFKQFFSEGYILFEY